MESNLIGQPVSKITDVIGYPTDNVDVPGVGEVLYWEMQFVTEDLNVFTNQFESVGAVCQFWAEPTEKGVIQSIRWAGRCDGKLKQLAPEQ